MDWTADWAVDRTLGRSVERSVKRTTDLAVPGTVAFEFPGIPTPSRRRARRFRARRKFLAMPTPVTDDR